MAKPQENFHPFESRMIPGAVTITVFAVLSTVAFISVVIRVAWLAVIPFIKGDHTRTSPREYVFFQTQLGIYSICLLTANLFNSVSGLIGISWLGREGIKEDPTCTVQAVISQIGNFGTAYFTIIIATHTFNSLVLRRRQSVRLVWGTIVIGWLTAVVVATLPMLPRRSQGFIYGEAGLSCAIRGLYPKHEFFLHLLPIFVASLTSVIMYSMIFLVLRGTLVIKGGIKLALDPHQRWGWRTGTLEEYHHFIAAIARSMLWFPFAYIALLLPYSIIRLLVISGFIVVSYGVIVFAFVCWFLLGFVNVLLLYHTIRVLGPAVDARLSIPTGKDTESFFSPVKVTQTTPSLLGPGQILPSGIDEKVAYHFPTRYSRQQSSYSSTHQSTPSASSGVSDRPLLSGHKYTTSNDSPASSLTAQSLQRAISPYSELNRQLIATPEPARRLRGLRVDTNVHAGPMPSLTPAPRHTRSAFERRPTLESVSSTAKASGNFDGSRSSHEDFNTVGRPNHRHPPLSAVAPQTSFGPSRTPTMTTTSSYRLEADYKHSPPPSAVVRSRQSSNYIFDYRNSATSASSYGNTAQDRPYSPGMTVRVLPAPKSRTMSARSARPPVFDPNAMVRSSAPRRALTSAAPNPHAARLPSPRR